MFWGFVVRLLIGGLVAVFAFSLMIVILLRILQPTATKGKWKALPADYPRLGLLLFAQLCFWGMWATYCAALAWVRSINQGLMTVFEYYAIAFLFLSGPIGYLCSEEKKLADSTQEVHGIRRGSVFYGGFAIVAFIIFALWPRFMFIIKPYAWILSFTVPIEERFGDALEQQYFRVLDGWVARGGPFSEVDTMVVPACGKLVMARLSTSQKIALSTIRRDDFRFMVDVCVKTTINRVYPQPDLTTKNVAAVCDRSGVPVFAALCKWGGLR
jgi:hypothetical protein